MSGKCPGGVWRLSGGVWVVSGECLGAPGGAWGVLDGVWMVFETLFPIRALCAPPRDIRKSRTPCLIGLKFLKLHQISFNFNQFNQFFTNFLLEYRIYYLSVWWVGGWNIWE